MQLNLYDKLIKYITRGAFRQGNAAGGGYEAYEETLCNLTYGDRSWIACGKERVDLARACEILASAFGVERMAVVGGGHINTAFPAAGQALARRQGRQLVLTYRRRGSRRGLPQRVVRARQRRGI